MAGEKYFEAYPGGLPKDRFYISSPEADQTPAADTVNPELRPTSIGDAWGQTAVQDLIATPNTQE